MLENSVLALLDPEFVVPSPSAARTPEFWLRMNEWADRPEYRLGPATLRVLHEIIIEPDPQWPIPRAELFQILSKLAARGISPSLNKRVVCEEHLNYDYAPDLGEDQNAQRLIADLSAVDANLRVGLGTARECWNMESRSCEVCHKSRITRVFQADPKASIAVAWRQSFLENYPSEVDKIKDLSHRMFPKLRFSSESWNDLRTLKGEPRDITASLVNHLSALNDLVIDIWSGESTTHERQRVLKAHGVDSSPENANTHKDKKAMRARRFRFGDREIMCEWHTKLHKKGGRIYFSVEEDEVYIGSIINHL
jgi:hypothetical protein